LNTENLPPVPPALPPVKRRRIWPWALTAALAAVLTFGLNGRNWSEATTHAPDWAKSALGSSNARAMPWRLDWGQATDPASMTPQDPEHMVRQIYAQLGQGERAQALATASLLASAYPNFQLGQLLYADLLNISIQKPVSLQEVDEANEPSLKKRLNELVLESRRRLHRLSVQDLQGKVPSSLLYLSPQQSHAAVVDASRSRLYWFENRPAPDGRLQLKLVRETYVSVGVNGTNKSFEGDGKTPLGVYFILKQLPGDTLPDLFGVGALTLNYPNAIDLMRKKTGSGIWLHGTPSAQYARAPESTDGCVVLANPVMEELLNLPELRMTPVVMAAQLEWVSSEQTQSTWLEFKPSLDQWLQARNGHNPEALKKHYSARYERDNLTLEHWWPRLAQTTLGHVVSKPLELMSVLQWQDAEQTMVVTLKDPNLKADNPQPYLRTYWQKEANQWKLVFQGPT
jgi:hypothetical protein